MQAKPATEVAQISAKSDKVMYEKFDVDFTKACKELGIVSGNAQEEDIEKEEISLATMSALFG